MKKLSFTAAISRSAFVAILISTSLSFSRSMNFDSDVSSAASDSSAVLSYEERLYRQQLMDKRIADRHAAKEQARKAADLRNQEALDLHRCSNEGKSPEEQTTICISEDSLNEARAAVSQMSLAAAKNQIRNAATELSSSEVGSEKVLIKKLYFSKIIDHLFFYETKNRRLHKMMSNFDESRFIAFVRAARVCTELDSDGSFSVKGSSGCESVRQSILMGSLTDLRALTGKSISEIAEKMETGELNASLLARHLDATERAELSARNGNESARLLALSYLIETLSQMNSDLKK